MAAINIDCYADILAKAMRFEKRIKREFNVDVDLILDIKYKNTGLVKYHISQANALVDKAYAYFGVSRDLMSSSKQTRDVSDIRMMVMHYLRVNKALRINEVAAMVSRDRSTCLHGIARHKDLLQVDKQYAARNEEFLKHMYEA